MITDLKVRSRTSVEQYRNTEKSIPAIGREIDVAYILEGAIQAHGNQLKVNVQLIEAETDNQLWADSYEGEYSEEIFAFQGNTATRIATSLNSVITP